MTGRKSNFHRVFLTNTLVRRDVTISTPVTICPLRILHAESSQKIVIKFIHLLSTKSPYNLLIYHRSITSSQFNYLKNQHL